MDAPGAVFLADRVADTGLRERCADLEMRLRSLPSALIGFSGGADSTLLTAMARRALGRDRVKACIAVGPSLPARELEEARALAAMLDVALSEHAATEFSNPDYVANGPERCFHCKADLFVHLARFAAQAPPGAALLYGGNLDDTYDFRPGHAAAAEAGARAPMAEAGLTKADVRALSRLLGLPTADKPAQPCLSSRIPYGQAVTPAKLASVEAGEEFLRSMGFREYRLRHFGDFARVEVPIDQAHLFSPAARVELESRLRRLGFDRVEIDPEGFRSGKLNQDFAGVAGIPGPRTQALGQKLPKFAT